MLLQALDYALIATAPSLFRHARNICGTSVLFVAYAQDLVGNLIMRLPLKKSIVEPKLLYVKPTVYYMTKPNSQASYRSAFLCEIKTYPEGVKALTVVYSYQGKSRHWIVINVSQETYLL